MCLLTSNLLEPWNINDMTKTIYFTVIKFTINISLTINKHFIREGFSLRGISTIYGRCGVVDGKKLQIAGFTLIKCENSENRFLACNSLIITSVVYAVFENLT